MMFPRRGQPDLLKNVAMKRGQEAGVTAGMLKENTFVRW